MRKGSDMSNQHTVFHQILTLSSTPALTERYCTSQLAKMRQSFCSSFVNNIDHSNGRCRQCNQPSNNNQHRASVRHSYQRLLSLSLQQHTSLISTAIGLTGALLSRSLSCFAPSLWSINGLLCCCSGDRGLRGLFENEVCMYCNMMRMHEMCKRDD